MSPNAAYVNQCQMDNVIHVEIQVTHRSSFYSANLQLLLRWWIPDGLTLDFVFRGQKTREEFGEEERVSD